MASAQRTSLVLPVPRRGMNVRDLKFPSVLQSRKLANMRLGKFGNLIRRPGYQPFYTDFATKKFYGFHPYIDSANIERLITVNDQTIVEFNENTSHNRLTGLSADVYSHFVTALGACFMSNGKENKKGLDDTWAEWGVQGPPDAPTLTPGTSGGSLPDGDYLVRYSYVVKSGTSRLIITAHDFEAETTVSGGGGSGKIDVTNIRTSSNSRVTHIIVWVTQADGSALYYSDEITNGTTSATITAEPDTAGLAYADYANNQGPVGAFQWHNYNDARMWAIDLSDPANLYPSRRGTNYDLEYFPTVDIVNMSRNGKPLIFCFGLNGDQFGMTNTETFVLRDSDTNGIPIAVSEKIGTSNPYSWAYWNNGIIGLTNRGIEFFDGFKFTLMSDDIYPLIKDDQNATIGQGFVRDDPEFGQLYQYCARIPNDTLGGPENIPGYLPGSGTGGTGIGLPSDDFDDNSLSTSRWNYTTGNATLTESGGVLNVSKTDASVEDVYVETTSTQNQSLNVSAEAAVTAHTGSDHDLTQYLTLYKDSDNYAEIGYRDVNGTLSIRSKIVADGTVTTDDITSVPNSTTFRIRLSHNKFETMYTDSVGAWSFAGAVYDAGYTATGWTVRLGVRTDTAGAAPTYTATFDTLRVQCRSGSGFEEIVPEELETENTNLMLTCTLRAWNPGIFDREAIDELQPPWTIETVRAQRIIVNEEGRILHLDNTTGKCYESRKYDIFDDQEYVPVYLEGKIIDGMQSRTSLNIVSMPARVKYITFAHVAGNWGMPFYVTLVSYPTLASDERQVLGFASGVPMNAVQMINNALANVDGVSYKVKFKKIGGDGTANAFIIEKMDTDPSFAMELMDSEINIARSRL